MAANKKSVLLYCDIIHTVEKMDDKTAGLFFKHYLRYINDLDPKTDNQLVDIAFESIKQNLKRDLKKWEDKKGILSNSGSLGNLKRWHIDLYKKVMKEEITLEEANVIAKHRKASPPDKNIAVTVNVNDTVNVNVKDIKQREQDFKKSLQPYLSKYGKHLLNEFYLYWTEKKPKGKKMRFEMEKVFDVKRRLGTWSNRNYNKSIPNNETKPEYNEDNYNE